jgi:hypothetical protein
MGVPAINCLSAFPGDEPPGRTSPYTTATTVFVDELREAVIEEDELYDTIEESKEEEWHDTVESVEDREEGDRDTSFIQPRRKVKAKRSRISKVNVPAAASCINKVLGVAMSHKQQMESLRPMRKRIRISQDNESVSKEAAFSETRSEVVSPPCPPSRSSISDHKDWEQQMESLRPMRKRIRISQDNESVSKEAALSETRSEVVSPPCPPSRSSISDHKDWEPTEEVDRFSTTISILKWQGLPRVQNRGRSFSDDEDKSLLTGVKFSDDSSFSSYSNSDSDDSDHYFQASEFTTFSETNDVVPSASSFVSHTIHSTMNEKVPGAFSFVSPILHSHNEEMPGASESCACENVVDKSVVNKKKGTRMLRELESTLNTNGCWREPLQLRRR